MHRAMQEAFIRLEKEDTMISSPVELKGSQIGLLGRHAKNAQHIYVQSKSTNVIRRRDLLEIPGATRREKRALLRKLRNGKGTV
jgi:hypothetical protein